MSSKIYFNGHVTDGDKPLLSPLDVQYGQGLFETIKVTDGRPWFLKEHIERLANSCRAMDVPFDKSRCDASTVSEFIEKAGLATGLVRLKLTVMKGAEGQPIQFFIGKQEKQLVHKEISCGGYPQRRSCPLARHKTLNYAYYLLARKWAKSNGFDYAILLDPNGIILEADMANFFLYREGVMLIPTTDSNRLVGITERIICDKILPELAIPVEEKDIRSEDINENCSLFLSNSMIDFISVARYQQVSLKPNEQLAEQIRQVFRRLAMS